jgi:hypothetical protein
VKENSSADFVALLAIILCIISGSYNLHLAAENSRLSNEYQGFRNACAYK